MNWLSHDPNEVVSTFVMKVNSTEILVVSSSLVGLFLLVVSSSLVGLFLLVVSSSAVCLFLLVISSSVVCLFLLVAQFAQTTKRVSPSGIGLEGVYNSFFGFRMMLT